MRKSFKNWLVDLELALIAGAFITLLLVVFAPFYTNTAFMVRAIGNASTVDLLKLIGMSTVPTIVSITIYTIRFFVKK